MPFIEAPVGTTRCVIHMTVQGQEALCVNYVNVGGIAGDAADYLVLANGVFDAWNDTFLQEQSNELTLEKVVVTDVEQANGIQVESDIAPAAGIVAQPAVNNALAFLIGLNTGQSGRSFRGRMFIPGGRIDEIGTDSNYWGNTYVSDMQAAATAYVAAINTLTPIGATPAELDVVSYYELDPLLPPGERSVPRDIAVSTPVTTATAKSRISTQRRRRPRS